ERVLEAAARAVGHRGERRARVADDGPEGGRGQGDVRGREDGGDAKRLVGGEVGVVGVGDVDLDRVTGPGAVGEARLGYQLPRAVDVEQGVVGRSSDQLELEVRAEVAARRAQRAHRLAAQPGDDGVGQRDAGGR